MLHKTYIEGSRSVLALLALGLVGCSGGGGGGAPAPVGPSAPPPTLTFASPTVFGTGGIGGRGLLVADVDGDGHADVFIANETLSNVSLLRGQSDGSLLASSPLAAPSLVAAAVAADVDGDRRVDLVSASGVTGTATVSTGVGDGSFNAGVALPVPWPVRKLMVTDWNGDGIADLLAASALTSEIGLWLGTGGGGFGPVLIATLAFTPADLVVADIDRDQRPDVVTTGQGAGRIDVLRNDGVGGFLPAVVTTTSGRGGKLECCDLNGDRIPDLVSLDADLTSVTVFLGVAGSTFSAGVTIGMATTTINSLSIGDLDGDGLLDVAAAAGSRITAAYGTSGGGLGGSEVLWTSPTSAASVVVADLRGIGVVDIACVVGGDQVALLTNPTARPAGMTTFGDGTPDCRGRIGMWAVGTATVGNAEFAYSSTNCPADAVGVFMQGGPADPAGSDPFQNGVLVHVGFGLLLTRLVFSDQLGRAIIADPVPNDPGLVGLAIHAQTMWLADPATTCSTSPANLVSSRGFTVVIQP